MKNTKIKIKTQQPCLVTQEKISELEDRKGKKNQKKLSECGTERQKDGKHRL